MLASIRGLVLPFAMIALVACGEDPLGNDDDGDSNDASDNSENVVGEPSAPTPVEGNDMTGEIAGKPWTLVTGFARIYKIEGKKRIRVKLLGVEENDPCGYEEPRAWFDGGFLEVSYEEGAEVEYDARFSYYDSDRDTDETDYLYGGKITAKFSEVGENVEGTLAVYGDPGFKVSGTFSVEECR